MKSLIFISLLCCFSSLFSQTKIANHYQLGDSLLLASQFDEALIEYNTTSKTFKSTNDWENYLLGKDKAAYCLLRLGEFVKAERLLEESAAFIHTQKITNPELLQSLFRKLGEVYLNEGDFNAAITHFEKEANFFSEKTDNKTRATNKSQLGIAQSQLGNFYTALEYLKQALALRQLNNDIQGIADTYNNIGLLHASKNEGLALDNYERALTFYQESVGKTHPSYLNTLNNQAIIYRSTKETEKALTIFETVLKKWKDLYGQNHANIAFTYSNIGLVYLDFNLPDTALAYQKKALNIYKNSYGIQHPEIANTHNQMANIYRSQKQYDEAIVETEKSIAANCKAFKPTDKSRLPNPKNPCLSRQLLAVTLHLRAQIFIERHYNKTLKINDLKAALETLQTCDVVIEEQRHFLTSKTDKISLGQLASEVYEDAISTAFTLSENSITHKKEFLAIAFQFAEKSKAAVLLESIADANAKSFANIPTSILEKEASLTHQINALSQELLTNDDLSKRQELLDNMHAYEDFILNLENEYPEYYDLKYNVKLAAVEDIQKKLDDKTLLLSYFIAESSQRLYIFKIAQKKFSVINAPLLPDLNNQISGFRNSLYYSIKSSYLSSSQQLYKQLFPKHLPVATSNLIIIPDGRLGVIPFEALLTKKTQTIESYSSLPYLVNKYEINYNFSATLYLQSFNKSAREVTPEILLAAPITFDNLTTLPGTQEEVEAIAHIFQSKGIRTSSYTNEQATESRIKSNETSAYSYIHFATHGKVDENYPELSQIYLKRDGQNDGNLYTSEIYALKLHSKLVTVSACETGLGQISRGEGIVGLSRSLIFAGAENLIVSYWQVADNSTSKFMVSFYENMMSASKRDIGVALRNSKLEMIRSTTYSAPYYWAPFVLIGN